MHSAMQIVRNSRILVVHVDASSYKGEYDALMLEAAAAGTLVLTNGETRYPIGGCMLIEIADIYFGSHYSVINVIFENDQGAVLYIVILVML